MNRLCFSKASVHPVPSTSLSRCSSADTIVLMLYTDGASVHPVLKTSRPKHLCMLLCDRRIDRCFLLTKVSVHPVLKGSSWRVSVLIQTKRRIDQRYPFSDRRIIRCYCLRFFFSATRPTLLKNGPSVHPTVPWFSPSVPTRPTIAPTLAIYVPSVHPTVSFSFLFFLVFDSWKIDYLLNLACGILASLGPRNVYKNMLDNMVSLIDHVVMNHQNQTPTNGKWSHVRYRNLCFFIPQLFFTNYQEYGNFR
jgi:hypothetical protein